MGVGRERERGGREGGGALKECKIDKLYRFKIQSTFEHKIQKKKNNKTKTEWYSKSEG